ncbi:MAG: hypothetical protein QXE10_02935 [Desulfurococcaceae archaeon]|jgi:hypothetical protein
MNDFLPAMNGGDSRLTGEVRDYLVHYYRDVYGDGGVGVEIAIK